MIMWIKKRLYLCLIIILFANNTASAEQGCLSCHKGIENFTDGEMMETIKAMGQEYGDSEGCVICHGGNPLTKIKEEAHRSSPSDLQEVGGPQMFYPDPGNIWIAKHTCGQCHQGYPERLEKALMNTEAGKLQGNLWTWGLAKDHEVIWGNYDIEELIKRQFLNPVVKKSDDFQTINKISTIEMKNFIRSVVEYDPSGEKPGGVPDRFRADICRSKNSGTDGNPLVF